MNKATLAILTVCLLAGVAIGLALLSQQYTIPTTGQIAEVSATLAEDGTEIITLDWGVTLNGVPYVYEPINVTNTGNLPVTLTLVANASTFINVTTVTLAWNYTGQVLQPNDSVIVIIEQTVTSTAPPGSGYTYDTLITAVEYEEP